MAVPGHFSFFLGVVTTKKEKLSKTVTMLAAGISSTLLPAAAAPPRLSSLRRLSADSANAIRHISGGNSFNFPCQLEQSTSSSRSLRTMSWLAKIGFGSSNRTAGADPIAQGPDDDVPMAGKLFAQFGAGCFWGVELAFQRVPGVVVTEVGYTQGNTHQPTYEDVCSGMSNHSEVVRLQYDPALCNYDTLLDVFWSRHDPTTLNRQGNDVGTQYRSGIYFYTPEQEAAALASLERQQQQLSRKIVTEILPAKKFYRAEEYHQQYLAKGGRFGFRQSAAKGCNDPIRCYG